MFNRLDPLVIKRSELLEAELALLSYQNGFEYHRAMVGYMESKIKRLTADIQRDEDERHRLDVAKRMIESGKTAQAIPLSRNTA
jgi:hypothetical protein